MRCKLFFVLLVMLSVGSLCQSINWLGQSEEIYPAIGGRFVNPIAVVVPEDFGNQITNVNVTLDQISASVGEYLSTVVGSSKGAILSDNLSLLLQDFQDSSQDVTSDNFDLDKLEAFLMLLHEVEDSVSVDNWEFENPGYALFVRGIKDVLDNYKAAVIDQLNEIRA